MKVMRIPFIALVLLALATACVTLLQSGTRAYGSMVHAKQAQTSSAAIARGKYLVEDVARCWECHTPVKDDGSWDRNQWLRGGRVFIRPVVPNGNWAERAPGIAGFPGFTEEQGEHILEKGEAPDGRALQPPMHTYHLNHADAVAIIAYLKSLSSSD
jgi:mono/diheme cytochrome c family protein